VGTGEGTVKYFSNTGTAYAAVFTELTGGNNPLDSISLPTGTAAPSYVHPTFVDIDGDGIKDCFIGAHTGVFYYYQNMGSSSSPAFAERTAATDHPLFGVSMTANTALNFFDIDADCGMHNNCNGHGICKSPANCICYAGWGAAADIAIERALDCSKRTCPSGPAWIDGA
jgi:hypothetical protein